jgi:hypothetical protein
MDKINAVSATMIGGGKLNSEASAQIRACLTEIPAGTQVIIGITPFNSIAGALDIVPLDQLLKDAAHLEKMSRNHVDHTQVEAVMDLLNELSTWLPYAGKLQGNAKYYLRVAQSNALSNLPDWALNGTPTDRKRWSETQCAEYEALYEQCERMVAAITHRCDHLRTFVSYEKSLASLNNIQK